MPVKRLDNQINLRKSDSVILIYGQVNDSFVTPDLKLYNIDGIEKIICRYLKENGYEQIIFYAPERQLYAYDVASYEHCFPKTTTPINDGSTTLNQTQRVGDRRPLGKKRFLKPKANKSSSSIQPSSANNENSASIGNSWKWHKEGFISIVQGRSDGSIVDIIREALFQNERKSAVIFSQFDNAVANNEIQRLVLPLIPRLQRRTSENKCIFITNAVDHEKLKEEVDSNPSLSKIVKMEDAGKGLDSLIYIGYPQRDEIKNLLNRVRVLEEKEVDWKQFDKIIVGLDQGRDELKKWEREFQDVAQFDIPSINQGLRDPISEDDQTALIKLNQLIGLNKVKSAIRRHLLQIQDTLENAPSGKPLMHIVLKGNPGTGKTTLARLIAQIFREEGLLERGHLVEVDREKLVAGHVGQTAIKTDKSCREAFGGVLFVDEAYALATTSDNDDGNNGSQDFGKEAIDTLIKRMTDWQGQFCVILAGYPEDMDRLLAANPGFSGRIGLTVVIDDYSPEELLALFKLRVEHLKRVIAPDFEEAMLNIFTHLYKKRGKKFDNARTVEQIFGQVNGYHLERCIENQLDRKVEPFCIEDIPKQFKKNTKKVSVEGNAMERLEEMIGLEKAKIQINKQVALIQAERQIADYATNRRLHLIFKGNPGTGKTTVARILGEVYQHYEILSNNNFVEVSRKDLVGAYQGQTTKKVEKVCKEALGGILFIDEAYTLINGDSDNYGREAVDSLLKIMEDNRDNLCVIMAGYPKNMTDFLESNPGLERRFSAQIEFEDYNTTQLFAIFQLIVSKKNIRFQDGFKEMIKLILKSVYERRDENFGNAGVVENIIQGVLENHALRCLRENLDLKNEEILKQDIPDSSIKLLPVSNSDEIIEEAMKELNELVGLESIKSHVNKLVKEYKHEQKRLKRTNKPASKRSYHMIFSGNPGTGKTTVARILGKIFKALDILKEGKVIEVSRPDFMAGYQGQTAEKTRKLIKSALDNVLFIDEAYSLVRGVMDSYGREAIDVLLKMMEDHRSRLIVIATGYPRDMNLLLKYNVGLGSRFSTRIKFQDFTPEESTEILKMTIREKGYDISDDLDVELIKQMNYLKAQKGLDYGNARSIKDFFNQVVMPLYFNRIEYLEEDDENMWTITEEDFPPLPEEGIISEENENKFSPNQTKNDQRDAVAVMNHAGSGDNVRGDKNVTNNFFGAKDSDLPKDLAETPSLDINKIFGRTEEIAKLYEQISRVDTPNKVLIYGMQGVGKTMLTIKFIETYRNNFEHIIWIDIRSTFKRAFIENSMLLKTLGIDFTEKEDEDTRYIKVLIALKKIGKNSLLIIDNIGKGAVSEFKKLKIPEFKILGTSREDFMRRDSFKLETLEMDSAIKLFKEHCEENIAVSSIEQLLKKVSNHPSAIELFASAINSTPNITIDGLMETINENVLLNDETSINSLTENFFNLFSSIFYLNDLTKEEQKYLTYFSVLPSYFIKKELLQKVFLLDEKEDFSSFDVVVKALKSKGLLVENKHRGIYCQEIIQQICRAKFQPSLENCEPLFTFFGRSLEEEIDTALNNLSIFSLIEEYLNILEHFISFFTAEELSLHRIYINLSVLYRTNGQFDESARISEKGREILEPIKTNYPDLYSISLRNIAFAKSNKGDYLPAEECYKTNVTFLENLDFNEYENKKNIERELIYNYAQLGIMQLRVEKYDILEATKFFEKGMQVDEESTNKHPAALASLKEGLAMAQIEQGNCELAIVILGEAKILIKGRRKSNNLSSSALDMNLAIAHAGKHDFKNAQFYASQAMATMKNHLPEGNLEYYRAFNVAAIVNLQSYMHQIDLEEEPNMEMLNSAEDSIKKAIEILRNNRGDEHEDLALMYSNYGLIMKYKGRGELGYQQHLKGLSIYKKMGSNNNLVVGMYFRSFFFFGEEITPKDSEEYLNICLDIIPKEIEYMVDIGFIHYCLGIVKHSIEKGRDALVHFGDALNCVRKYFGKTILPLEPDKDSALEVVCLQELATVHSGLKEHIKAMQCQKEAVDLCVANMENTDPELLDPYLRYANICLKAGNDLEQMEYFALSLEYKQKATRINAEEVLKHPELEDAGVLYLISHKGETEEISNYFIVIPNKQQAKFEEDFNQENLKRLGYYGHVMQRDKKLDLIVDVQKNVQKYGAVNTDFVLKSGDSQNAQ